jgi:Rrf2 family protein
MMVHLAGVADDKTASTREISDQQDISYVLACKLMQKLHKAKLVESKMGAKGGFRLSRNPAKISLLEMIAAIQGPVTLNRCLLALDACKRQKKCTVNAKLIELQKSMDTFLAGVTLDELTHNRK